MLVKTKYTSITLANGLRAHIITDPRAIEILRIEAVVHAGACHDEDGKEGAAHFLEHVVSNSGVDDLFEKGSAEDLESEGVEFISARTTNISTEYSFEVPANKSRLILAFNEVSRFLFNEPTCREFEKERAIILSEFATKYHSRGDYIADLELSRALFDGHVLGERPSPLGSIGSIRKLNEKSVIAFHKKHYKRVNTSIVVMSNLASRDVINALDASVLGRECDQESAASPRVSFVSQGFSKPFSKLDFAAGRREEAFYRPLFAMRAPEGLPAKFAELICSAISTLFNHELREELKISYGLRARIQDYDVASTALLVPEPMIRLDFVDEALAALREILTDVQKRCGDDAREFAVHKRTILESFNNQTPYDIFAQALIDCRTQQIVRPAKELRREIVQTNFDRVYESGCAMISHGVHTSLVIR